MVRPARAGYLSAFIALLIAASPALGEVVLLQFTSPTCGPCQQMQPDLRRFAADGYPVQMVDVSRDRQTPARFRVDAWPTSILLVDGVEQSRCSGAMDYQQLVQFFSQAQPQSSAADGLRMQSPNRVGVHNPASAPSASSHRQASHADLIASTVRLSVDDPEGRSSGTGTMIDSYEGETLVLTCGHIFRSSQGNGEINVTLFRAGPGGAEPRETVPGRLIDFDLKRDLALVAIRAQSPVRVAPVAPSGTALTPGVGVVSVGCNHGQNPTALDTRITSVNRYQGPPNVEIAGAPVEGRSGGGLFSSQGQVIGVCFAADQEGDEGLYASLPSIQEKLDQQKLTVVYENPSGSLAIAAANASADSGGVPAIFAVRGQGPDDTEQPAPRVVAPQSEPPSQKSSPRGPLDDPHDAYRNLIGEERAALEEIVRRGADSEVVCIIRPRGDEGSSEVIRLSRASPAFLKALTSAFESAAVGP